MNTWNTPLESYQQSVYKNTLATVNHQIQQAKNPMPAVVISVEAVRVDNAILLDHLTSEVPLEEPEIGSTHPNITIDHNCTADKLHLGIPGGSKDYDDGGEESDKRYAIPTASRWWYATTELERFDLRTSDINGNEGEDVDDVDADEEEEGSQADDGSTQNEEDWGQSTRQCDDWTVYFGPDKYDNANPDATASDVSEAKTGLYKVTPSQS